MNDTTNNLPDEGGTGDDVSDIMDTLADEFDDDPVTDNAEDSEANAGEADGPEAEDEDSSESDDVDGEEAEPEDSDDDTDDETPRGPDRPRDEKGRFVSDEARVQLPDGTTATIADLKSGAMRQSDYTRKTQELASNRQAFEAEQTRVSQLAQQLDQQIEQARAVLEAFEPRVPQNPEELDAYHAYRQQYEQLNQQLETTRKERQETLKAEQESLNRSRLDQEYNALLREVPELREPAKYQSFMNDTVRIAGELGYSPEELAATVDHRPFKLFKRLMDAESKLKQIETRRAPTKKAVESAPRMNTGRKRGTSKTANRRSQQARTERLKSEGTLDAGVASLMDLDL